MNVARILQVTRSGFNEFFDVWKRHTDRRGPGALSFNAEECGDDLDDEVTCEYWTLGELRNYLRKMDECDEVVYVWLRAAENVRGYPIVIFSPGGSGGNEKLHFSVVTREQVM